MDTRRELLTRAAILSAAAAVFPQRSIASEVKSVLPLKTSSPRKALVFWLSQTGHTGRMGRVIARAWEKRGLKVICGDIRDIDKASVSGYDLIAAGSPVFYYDVPGFMQEWLRSMPRIDGTPVASFVTYGGRGGNQYNTGCTLLELCAKKGAVPMGMELFSNMSAFAPTWSAVSEERILEFRHLPNRESYERARQFASNILGKVSRNERITVRRKLSFSDLTSGGVSIGLTKLMIGRHAINERKCIQCGACVEKCIADAIDIQKPHVDTGRCVACMGCVNNCPTGAMEMKFMGKNVYGFKAFLAKHRIVIEEPVN